MSIALQRVAKERKVMLNRAPSLHKFSLMSFEPKIVDGKSIKFPTLPMKGFNADVDGDQMSVHVPVSSESNIEAEKALPTKNLVNPRSGDMMLTPDQDAVLGLYWLTNPEVSKKSNLKFSNEKDLIASFNNGDITGNEKVKLNGMPVIAGRVIVKNIIPDGMKILNEGFTKKNLQSWLKELASKKPGTYGNIVNNMSQLGNKAGYLNAHSLTLKDLTVGKAIRDKYFQKAFQKTKGLDGNEFVQALC